MQQTLMHNLECVLKLLWQKILYLFAFFNFHLKDYKNMDITFSISASIGHLISPISIIRCSLSPSVFSTIHL